MAAPSRNALVVGVDHYSAPFIRDLAYAASDAVAMAEALALPEFGFHVTTLVDGQATRQSVLRHLAELRNASADLNLFYFAGHGVTTDLGSFLVTHDAAPFEEGLELKRIVNLLGSAKGKQCDFVAILDCCNAGAVTLPDAPPYMAEGIHADEIRKSFRRGPEGRRAVMASCLADQLAGESPSLGHGIFTYYILNGLLGAAADHTGRLTLSSLHEYASGQLAERGIQTPVFYGAFAGNSTIGEGLEPCLGPPLETDEREQIIGIADELIDTHRSHRVSPEWEAWAETGFKAASQELATMAAWFDKQMARYPQLRESESFMERFRELQRFRADLGTLSPGTHLVQGVAECGIGEGSFGSVWRVASQADPAVKYAYKVYHPNELSNPEKTSRFRRGFTAMQSLDHPRIVKVQKYTEAPLGFFMDFVDGSNLKALGPANSLPLDHTIGLLVQVAEAINHAHNRKVVHRDIKPENIVCRYDPDKELWTPFLTDFDLAWINTGTQVTREGLGNLLYAAPEQLMNFTAKAVSGFFPSLDVFSMGQIAYFCLVGGDPNPTQLIDNQTNFERALSKWPSGEAARAMMELYANSTEYHAKNRIDSMSIIIERLRGVQRALLPEGEYVQTAPRFLAELAFTFTGRPIQSALNEQNDGELTFHSTSEQTQLHAKAKLTTSESIDLNVHVVPNERISFQGISNEIMRRKLNRRIDDAISVYPEVERRSGKLGPFSVYIDIKGAALTPDGLARCHRIVNDAVSVIESSQTL